VQPLDSFPAFHGTAFTRALHLFLS
jgi:hypothetical protein